MIEVLRSSNSTKPPTNLSAGNCSRWHKSNPKQKGTRDVDQLSHVDYVTTNAHSSQGESQLYIFEDNEVVIKMIIKGRCPTMRHVSRTHRVAPDWHWRRWERWWWPRPIGAVDRVFTNSSEQKASKWIHVVQGRLNKSSGNIQARWCMARCLVNYVEISSKKEKTALSDWKTVGPQCSKVEEVFKSIRTTWSSRTPWNKRAKSWSCHWNPPCHVGWAASLSSKDLER